MKPKKGWTRVTLVVSILGGIVIGIYTEEPQGMVLFFVFTWITYFSIIWIIKGFQEHEMNGIKNPGVYSDPAAMDPSVLTLSRGYSDSVIYEGKFVDGQFTGRGKFTFLDGSKYEGHIKDNKPHGEGTLYPPAGLKDGLIWEGIFRNGKLVAPKKSKATSYEFRPQ